jgi:toxin FitB
VFKRVLQQRDETAAIQAVALMEQGRVVPLDGALAMTAAKLSAELRLPMADSIILATAREFGAVLWTQDADFDGLDGVRFFPKGNR